MIAWLAGSPAVASRSGRSKAITTEREVDSHHHRVASRLGLIPTSASVSPAHALLEAQLPADWSAQQVYDNHEALMLHGQKVCFPRGPKFGQVLIAISSVSFVWNPVESDNGIMLTIRYNIKHNSSISLEN